jgi:hypothetical protein
MGLSNRMIGMGIIIFFAFLMIDFAVLFLGETNPNAAVLAPQYGLVSTSNVLNSSLDSFTQLATSMKTQMANAKPDPLQFIFLIFKDAFYIVQGTLQFTVGNVLVVGSLLTASFGGGTLGTIVATGIGLLVAALIIMFVFLIVEAARTGNVSR